MTPAIDKMDGRGLINTACHECLPKKTKVTQYAMLQPLRTTYHSSPGVLQLPLECATTSLWNAYNYATTSNGMLHKFQGTLIQTPETPLLIKRNISISIVGLS